MQGGEVGAGRGAVHQMPTHGLGVDVSCEVQIGKLGLAGESVRLEPVCVCACVCTCVYVCK